MPMKSLGAAPSAMMPYRGNQHCLSCALIYELAGSAVGLQRCGKDKQHNTAAIARVNHERDCDR